MITKIKTLKLVNESFGFKKEFQNDEFNRIIEMLEFISRWYKEEITSQELADGLRYAINKYKDTYPYDEIIDDQLEFVGHIEEMDQPDNLIGSASIFNWFGDIDSEDMAEDDEYDELETKVKDIYQDTLRYIKNK